MAEMILHEGTYYTADDFAALKAAEKTRARKVRAAAGGSSRVDALEDQVAKLAELVDDLSSKLNERIDALAAATSGDQGDEATTGAASTDSGAQQAPASADGEKDDKGGAEKRTRSSRGKKEAS